MYYRQGQGRDVALLWLVVSMKPNAAAMRDRVAGERHDALLGRCRNHEI